jgi:hypothetical protein
MGTPGVPRSFPGLVSRQDAATRDTIAGVDEVPAGVEVAVEQGGGSLVAGAPAAVAEGHRAQGDRADPQARPAQGRVRKEFSFLSVLLVVVERPSTCRSGRGPRATHLARSRGCPRCTSSREQQLFMLPTRPRPGHALPRCRARAGPSAANSWEDPMPLGPGHDQRTARTAASSQPPSWIT